MTRLCKGYGFIQVSSSPEVLPFTLSVLNCSTDCCLMQFALLENAKVAQSLNGQLDIAGRVIKVLAVTDHVGVQVSEATTGDFSCY
ncbi:unnamed protein product, partial [Urochloa humidicola]